MNIMITHYSEGTHNRMNFRQWIEMKYLEWQRNSGGRKTVLQFAEHLGVSQSTVSTWFNETRTPQGDNVRKIADKLGLEVYDVLGLERPDPILFYIQKHWDELPEEAQRTLLEQAEEYVAYNEQRKNPPTRPARKNKGTA